MATMKLKVKGNMAQIMRYSQVTVAMVKCTMAVFPARAFGGSEPKGTDA